MAYLMSWSSMGLNTVHSASGFAAFLTATLKGLPYIENDPNPTRVNSADTDLVQGAMMTSTRSILWVALLATALTSGLRAATLPAQQVSTTDDWCDDGGRDQRGDERETHCEVREFTVPASGASLSIDAQPNGGISVEGSARRDIHIRARVQTTARTREEARALAGRVEIIATADRVEARGPDESNRRESWSVSYRLAAPQQTPLNLRSTNGGISIKNVNSRIEFRTVNGGVSLSNVGGSVEGRTSNGGITVDLDGSTWQGEGLDVETSNGGVKLSLPETFAAHLEASTNNGGLNIDFPITVQGRLGRSISTDIGGGGPTLRIRTANGGVKVSRK
jgi:hypothetical protein